MLGDAAGLAGGDARLADAVQQARLAVVDVAHDGHDGRPGLKLRLLLVGQLLGDRRRPRPRPSARSARRPRSRDRSPRRGRVVVDHLVHGGEDAVLDERRDDLAGGSASSVASSSTVMIGGSSTVRWATATPLPPWSPNPGRKRASSIVRSAAAAAWPWAASAAAPGGMVWASDSPFLALVAGHTRWPGPRQTPPGPLDRPRTARSSMLCRGRGASGRLPARRLEAEVGAPA